MKGSPIIIYRTEDGKVKIETHFENETVWLSIEQIASLFQRERSVVSKHTRNIFKEGELEQQLVCAKFAQTTQVEKDLLKQIENKTKGPDKNKEPPAS